MRYYVVKKKSSHASELMDPWSLTDSRVHIWYRLKKESRQIKYAVPDITLKLLIINHLKLLLLPYSTIWGAKIRFYILASVAKYVSNINAQLWGLTLILDLGIIRQKLIH